MKALLPIVLLLLAPLAAADVYRWVDDDGVVHFSDEPRDGAERLDLREPSTMDAPRPRSDRDRAEERRASREDDAGDGEGYESVAVTRPEAEETIQSAPGRVPVSVAVEPGLQEGHRLEVLLDGSPVTDRPLEGTSTELENIDRGTHEISARVVDGDGEELIASEPVRFYLQRPSVNLPGRQGN